MSSIYHWIPRKLAEGGFDYIALGHRHQHQNLFKDWCLYPGALEPVDRNDGRTWLYRRNL